MSTVLLQQRSTIPHRHLHRLLTYCADCGRLSHENEAACQRCGGDALEQVSHIGEIYSYTTVNHSAGSFVLALVQLYGGPLRVTAQIVGADRKLKIGLPVEFTPGTQLFSDAGAGGLYFSPLGANGAVAK